MLARPAVAALSCRQCQTAIFRAVVSRPATTSILSISRQQHRQLPILTRRFISQQKSTDTETSKDQNASPKDETEDALESKEAASSEGDVPWFLEVEPPRHPPSQHKVELPKIPEDAPAFLEPMVKYIFEDMGLDDISLLDLRELDPPAALGPNLIMLFGTARSERHLHVSSGRFVRWLKRTQDISARADGLIGPGELRTKLRRLRKKAKLLGTNTAIIPGGDNGISTGWVCVNFSFNDGKSAEQASFDETGRFSGFGAPQTGTTVVVQCMTETRRGELELEPLWQGVLKRSLQNSKKVRGEKSVDQAELDALLASKVQLPTNASALQWQAMSRASQQQRHFSTMARRLAPVAEQEEAPAVAEGQGNTEAITYEQVREHARDIQLLGASITPDTLQNLIKAVFQSSSSEENTGPERLTLVDQLLQTADERGVSIWNPEMFVTVIESILKSPAYGEELKRAQKNFEYLMTSEGFQLDNDQVLRLMLAYLEQGDWEKFWDTFRIPPRFRENRDIKHYELAYRALAASKDQKKCIEALRWVYAEMKSQQPPIPLTYPLYDALKAAILVADPAAENLMKNPMDPDQLLTRQRRRYENREFLKLMREVEQIRESYNVQAQPVL